jgi:hypothetical protein
MRFILLINSLKRFICVSIIFFLSVVSAQAQNNSLHFDGSSDYVSIPHNSTQTMGNTITIETWVKWGGPTNIGNILMKGYYGYGLGIIDNGSVEWWNSSSQNAGPNSTSGAVTVGVWTHIAVVVDINSNNTKFYINGVLNATVSGAKINNSSSPLFLGRQGSGCNCNFYNGNLDELRIWNTARTLSEIQNNMNAELTTATGLVANYHFNQGVAGDSNGTVTSLTDASGNNNTGTLSSFALTGATSNWVASGVTFPPVISSFTPTSAGTGATITLTGTNFTGTTAVSFGGTAASSFTVISSTSITAVVASGTSGSISVTSNNSTATKTGFTYLSGNADLSALSISAGSLSPNFASGTTAYTANVSNAITSITVTPTQADVNASITVNGTPVVSGAVSSAIALNIGSNTITTIVTAQDTSTKTYTLTVTREMTPPGNALNFDGSNDYVNLGDVIEGFTTITFEAWVYHVGIGSYDEISSKSLVNSFSIRNSDHKLWFHLGNGINSWFPSGVASNSTIATNKWTHVAATWDGTTAKLYINGVLDIAASHTGTVGVNGNSRGIGGYGDGGNILKGKIDELRIYNSVLSQPAIATDMASTSATSANLIGYYNFDSISGNILIDKSTSNFNGTVTNGPTLVESYAMVVPATIAATSISTTGFTANWTAPSTGTVDNGYRLDVSTSSTFASFVSGYNGLNVGNVTTSSVTGLSPGSTYYYRVRADKTSVSGQGANSNIFSTATAAASSNANLSALSISDGTLSPSFASGTTAYTANVSNAITSITVTPTQADVNASITVNGTPVVSGAASSAIALNIGSNTITTIVIAQNGSTKTHTLTITREMTPPGNALNLDGSNDYVSMGNKALFNFSGSSSFTVEMWFKTSMTTNGILFGKGGYCWYPGYFARTTADGSKINLSINPDNSSYAYPNVPPCNSNESNSITITGTTTINDGNWHHMAVVINRSSGLAVSLYIDGNLDASGSSSVTNGFTNADEFTIGGLNFYTASGSPLYATYFNGTIDEIRTWNTARSQSEIQTNMNAELSISSGLIANYHFDQGIAAGTNTGLTSLTDAIGNTNNGTLNNFTLTGNSSNWVESYAMVVPTTTAAATISSTGFTANWTAPATGTVTNYILDVATDAAFTSPISGSPYTISSPILTKSITGLSPGSTYYYRVRADKTSVTGQGASSNFVTTTTAAASLNANLSTLSISAGTLSPIFASGTTAYTVNVSNAITSITVTSTQSDANATILAQVNGGGYATVVSGSASGSLVLNEGINTVDVKVTAQDGLTLKTYTMEVTRGEVPTISSFNDQAKYYFDGSYAIVGPTTNSTGAFSYSSNNTAVATINGTTVTIVGAGSATITATQAGNATYNSGSITSVLTVATVSVLTKSGGISTTNPSYVNKNGAIGKGIALSRNGAILAVKTPPPPVIGDFRDGGVVFWVDPADNTHGLVCAIEDQSGGIWWYNGSLITTGATGTAIGKGSTNTTAIIANQGPVATSYAAGLARDYDGGGYTDWFLPSKDELNEMYLNKATINSTAAANIGSSFATATYWSSTENDSEGASVQYFGNGFQSNSNKESTVSIVRAVRAF